MNRAEDCVPASRHDPSTASISDLARKFGAQSLQSRQRQQCAVPSPINENFAHQPNQPFSKSQGLFHTLDPFSNHTHHAPLSPPLDRSEPISPLEMTATTKPRPIPVPASDRPSSASDDTTASSPPPSVFSQTSYFASSHSSPTQTRPGSSASVESVPYSSASDHGIRRHRQRILRRQTSNSHLAEVRALITRMVDNGDMCEVTAGSRGTSPCPSRPSEDNTERGEEADTMDLDEDFASRPTTCSSRSNSDASNMQSQQYDEGAADTQTSESAE
ncbi:MAG: hypothetical protein M1828_003101 [Chrysothrix sp. TS-e1954]|nr:MAG: hypothetical protein M1828_003101 [Chrysothrix sp. TS-e1954]